MSSDHRLEAALRALAGQDGPGTIPPAAEIRRRGDTCRRRRRAASVSFAALAVVSLGVGVGLTRPGGVPPGVPVGPAGPTAGPTASTDPSPGATGGPTDPPTDPPTGPPTGPSGPPAGPPDGDPLLSGQRRVAIVRTPDAAGGLSLLDDGRLAEVDGDEGRQSFVFVPRQPDTYQIRVADQTDTCWEVRSSGSQPLRVEAAHCAPTEPRQRFTVVRDGDATYAISSHSAYLQMSRSRGLILEEAGDAPVTARFRLVDNGPSAG
ncbi:hypothetical protein O7606_03075 [Micromonospora sp. WMMD882]|uniref:RICIN domain-containing protein n=1 Tax=Micromonospora sp. WMMD882 TaxID=3015151 RepID=UPI00248BCFE8|nr:hypothetical protein [Micromonospora sp. WMMD882]WBB80378.1 hypothetical protein O7606_03075 [Micromonospora sp. WMMD882]